MKSSTSVESICGHSRLFNVAELRVGTGKEAELVRIYRGEAQAMRCPGDTNCPVWSERVAGR
jgi:hypothetical protein